MPVVRELISRFGFKVDKKGFDKADAGFTKLKTAAITVVGALVAGKLASTIRNITNQAAAMADQIDKTSKRLGVNVMALQELQFAAQLAGASNADVAVGLRTLARTADEASQGSAEYADEFKRLGVNVKDSNGQLKSAEVLFAEMADGLRKVKSETARVAIAQKLLGRGGATLIPLLVQGTEAIRAQRMEAKELGLFDEDLIALGVEYTDTNTRLAQALQAVRNIVAKALLPGFIRTKKAVVEWIKANKQFLRQNIGRVVKQLAEFIGRLVRVVIYLSRSFYDWAKSLDPLSARFLKISAIAAALAVALMLPGGSILLLIGLIALLIDDFETWREGGKSVTGDLIKAFQDWYDQTGGILGLLVDLWKWGWSAMWDAANAVFGWVNDGIWYLAKQIEKAMMWAWNKVKSIPIIGKLATAPAELLGGLAARVGAAAGTVAGGGGIGKAAEVLATGGIARAGPIAAGAQITNAPRTNINVNVQAKTGASAEEIGTQVAQQVDAANQRRNREAMQALTPAVAGIVPGS